MPPVLPMSGPMREAKPKRLQHLRNACSSLNFSNTTSPYARKATRKMQADQGKARHETPLRAPFEPLLRSSKSHFATHVLNVSPASSYPRLQAGVPHPQPSDFRAITNSTVETSTYVSKRPWMFPSADTPAAREVPAPAKPMILCCRCFPA